MTVGKSVDLMLNHVRTNPAKWDSNTGVILSVRDDYATRFSRENASDSWNLHIGGCKVRLDKEEAIKVKVVLNWHISWSKKENSIDVGNAVADWLRVH